MSESRIIRRFHSMNPVTSGLIDIDIYYRVWPTVELSGVTSSGIHHSLAASGHESDYVADGCCWVGFPLFLQRSTASSSSVSRGVSFLLDASALLISHVLDRVKVDLATGRATEECDMDIVVGRKLGAHQIKTHKRLKLNACWPALCHNVKHFTNHGTRPIFSCHLESPGIY